LSGCRWRGSENVKPISAIYVFSKPFYIFLKFSLKVEFIAAEVVLTDFYTFHKAVIVVIAVFGTFIFVLSQFSESKLNVKTTLSCCAMSYFLAMWLNYSATVANFISLGLLSDTVHLTYVGPFARTYSISSADISEVLFGLPGKTSNSCYLLIKTKAGLEFRSVTFSSTIEACKNQRGVVLNYLSKYK
jgi:hypothetical protein